MSKTVIGVYKIKDTHQLVTGRVCMEWGEQAERLEGARVFVVHSSSARADGWGRERLALYHELRRTIEGAGVEAILEEGIFGSVQYSVQSAKRAGQKAYNKGKPILKEEF